MPNSLGRTMWQKVIDAAKQALDAKGALLKASELCGSLNVLEKSLVEGEHPCSWKWVAVSQVDDVLTLLEAASSELTSEQSSLLANLQDGKNSIVQQAPTLEKEVPALEAFLQKQWLPGLESPIDEYFKLATEENSEQLWRNSTGAGQVFQYCTSSMFQLFPLVCMNVSELL